MKKQSMIKTSIFLTLATIAMAGLSFTACKKSNSNPSTTTNPGNSQHIVDAQLVGKWMWTKSSDGAYYDNNGTYNGAASGLAIQYSIGADGYGTCFNHYYSTIGAGTGMEVNISYKGFFESDNQGHLGFFPTSGTYKSGTENRALRADELWDTNSNTGNRFLYQKLIVTTQGGRACFQVTSTDDITDTFFKL